MFRLFLFLVLLVPHAIYAQKPAVVIHSPKVLDDLIELYRSKNPFAKPQGFRIILYSASGNHSRQAVLSAKSDFDEMTMGHYASYVSFEEPYYKLKAGNFRTMEEAMRNLKQFRQFYPNAFVVKDELDVEALLLKVEAIPLDSTEEAIPSEED